MLPHSWNTYTPPHSRCTTGLKQRCLVLWNPETVILEAHPGVRSYVSCRSSSTRCKLQHPGRYPEWRLYLWYTRYDTFDNYASRNITLEFCKIHWTQNYSGILFLRVNYWMYFLVFLHILKWWLEIPWFIEQMNQWIATLRVFCFIAPIGELCWISLQDECVVVRQLWECTLTRAEFECHFVFDLHRGRWCQWDQWSIRERLDPHTVERHGKMNWRDKNDVLVVRGCINGCRDC